MITFFTSPIGLGHATRDIAIAEKLRTDILFVSGEGASSLIARKGFKALDVYRPAKFIVEAGQLQHLFKWLMGYYLYYKKCKVIAKEILDNPHEGLIVSDEDFASIAVGKEMGQSCVLITDIIETHFTSGLASIIEKKMNKWMHKIMQRCDCVIIPEIGDDKDNIYHVGPIVRQASADRNTLRKLQGTLDSELVIVSGPSLKLPDSQEYRNLGFVDSMHDVIYAADLVISLAGRSTMDESMAYGTPGIFIPIKNHFEQEQGAARFGFKYEDIFRLEQLIEEKIGRRNNVVDMGGAARAAKIISMLV